MVVRIIIFIFYFALRGFPSIELPWILHSQDAIIGSKFKFLPVSIIHSLSCGVGKRMLVVLKLYSCWFDCHRKSDLYF